MAAAWARVRLAPGLKYSFPSEPAEPLMMPSEYRAFTAVRA